MNRWLFFLSFTVLCAGVRAQPAATNAYRFAPDFPKYVTAHVEIRDPSDGRWPSFFYGKPATNGFIQIDSARSGASFLLVCDKRPQENGDQSRRVLGESFDQPKKGSVALEINGMSAVESVAGKKGTLQTTFTGTLDVAGHRVPVKATGILRPHAAGRGDEKNESLIGELQFDTTAGELGLKTMAAAAPLHVRATFTAYAANASIGRKPRL